MANKAINIKQSEREVGQLVGELRGRGNKRMSFGNWHFELFRFGFDFVRLPVCLPRPLSDKCIDAFAFSIIIFLGFPSPPPSLFFCLLFFSFFPLQVDAKSFQLLWRHFLIALICFSRTFSPASIHDKSFSAHTHTHTQRQKDRQKSSQLSLWFSMCAWQRLVFQILHSTCSLLLLLPLRAPVLGVILDLTEKWKFNAFAKHNFRKFLSLLLI